MSKLLETLRRIWQIATNWPEIVKEVQDAIEVYKSAMSDGKISKEEAIRLAGEALDVIYLVIPELRELIGLFGQTREQVVTHEN